MGLNLATVAQNAGHSGGGSTEHIGKLSLHHSSQPVPGTHIGLNRDGTYLSADFPEFAPSVPRVADRAFRQYSNGALIHANVANYSSIAVGNGWSLYVREYGTHTYVMKSDDDFLTASLVSITSFATSRVRYDPASQKFILFGSQYSTGSGLGGATGFGKLYDPVDDSIVDTDWTATQIFQGDVSADGQHIAYRTGYSAGSSSLVLINSGGAPWPQSGYVTLSALQWGLPNQAYYVLGICFVGSRLYIAASAQVSIAGIHSNNTSIDTYLLEYDFATTTFRVVSELINQWRMYTHLAADGDGALYIAAYDASGGFGSAAFLRLAATDTVPVEFGSRAFAGTPQVAPTLFTFSASLGAIFYGSSSFSLNMAASTGDVFETGLEGLPYWASSPMESDPERFFFVAQSGGSGGQIRYSTDSTFSFDRSLQFKLSAKTEQDGDFYIVRAKP